MHTNLLFVYYKPRKNPWFLWQNIIYRIIYYDNNAFSEYKGVALQTYTFSSKKINLTFLNICECLYSKLFFFWVAIMVNPYILKMQYYHNKLYDKLYFCTKKGLFP